MPVVRTDRGALVARSPRGIDEEFTTEQAEANAAERNARAEKLGIQTRYVVTEE
jgi:hypothetical protein